MVKEIVLAAFEKAKKEVPSGVKSHWAQHIEDTLFEEYSFSVTPKTLLTYYNFYAGINNKEIADPKPIIIEHLCKFLNFKDYNHFIQSQPKEKNEQKNSKEIYRKEVHLVNDRGNFIEKLSIIFTRKMKAATIEQILATFIIILLSVSIPAILIKNNIFDNACMIWKNDHYEAVDCSGAMFEKQLNPKTLREMKQLSGYCKQSTFFQPNGDPAVWYDKHNNKLTFFTMEGIHPTNGRTLKAITQHIIDKYVPDCD